MKLPFDKVYCLHLAESVDRYESITKEFDRLGISDQVEFWWTCKRPISKQIGDSLESLHTLYYDKKRKKKDDVYAGVFNCAFEHYSIVKQAYLRGFNSILIIEDDIGFIDDLDRIEYIFNNLPNNYICVKFWSTHINNLESKKNFSRENFKLKSCSTACYCLDKIGMEKYINSMDRYFTCADMAFEKFIDDIYVVSNPICEPKGFNSEIHK